MRAAPIQESFNAGEFSELVSARVRFEKYQNAVKLSENMIPLVQGGMTRRTGSMHVAEVKTSADATRVVSFQYSITQAYIIEFGDQYCRFYKDRGQIESAPDTPYEIATPYLEADLFELKFTQSADVLYITHPDYAPRKLSRTGHTSWTLTVIDFLDGPYLPDTQSDTITITPSGTTGSITLTASAALFASTDVDRLVRLKLTGSANWGYVKITAYTDTTHVTATVKETLGAAAVSTEWKFGAWSDTTGYPSCCIFFEDRLCFAGGSYTPQRIDMSRTGDYENFKPTDADGTIVDDHAVTVTLTANDVNNIVWMVDDEKGLLVGTRSGEWMVRPSSLQEATTPTNVTAKRSTAYGSYDLQALRAGKAAIYVQRAGRKVRELAYVYEVDGFRSPDMTVLAGHVLSGGVAQFAYQQEPHSIVWFVRNDGQLIGLTYDRDQSVIGWHRHILGGSFSTGDAVVESVAVIPTPTEDADEVWLVVKRTVDGSTVRYIEYITPEFDDDDTTDAFFVDCGLTYDGVAATTISGLDHLEGETLSVLADGATHPDVTVSSGSVTLDRSASVVHLGLTYVSDIQTLRIEAGAANGTAQGKIKRINRVIVRLYKTLGLQYGPDADSLDVVSFRTSADSMGSPPSLFTGDKEVNWNGGYSRDGYMYFRQDQPLPFTLLGLFPHVSTQDG